MITVIASQNCCIFYEKNTRPFGHSFDIYQHIKILLTVIKYNTFVYESIDSSSNIHVGSMNCLSLLYSCLGLVSMIVYTRNSVPSTIEYFVHNSPFCVHILFSSLQFKCAALSHLSKFMNSNFKVGSIAVDFFFPSICVCIHARHKITCNSNRIIFGTGS